MMRSLFQLSTIIEAWLMNAAIAASHHYSTLSEHTRSAKDLEYDVILGVTRELTKVGSLVPVDFAKLAKVLNDNERLWVAIGTQVASPDNQLEASLRARLFYLAEFVTQQTSKVLSGQATLEVLVETNIAILRGLKGNI